jgi:hypothetical protein
MDESLDFYYSRDAEQRLLHENKEHRINNILINGIYYVYTECTEKGKQPLIKENDLVFLGTATLSDIVIGDIKGKRKIIEYVDRKCDGVCQLCCLDCRIKTFKLI